MFTNYLKIIVVFLLIFDIQLAHSDVSEGEIIHGKFMKGILPDKYLSYGGVFPNETTLSAVKEKYGEAESFQTSENGVYVLCYKSKRNPLYGVAFQAGAMGGWETITSIILGRLPENILPKCAVLNELSMNISDIQINMKKSKLYSLFKTDPSFKADDRVEYNYICEANSCEKNKKNTLIYIITGIIAKFKSDKLDYILLYHENTD